MWLARLQGFGQLWQKTYRVQLTRLGGNTGRCRESSEAEFAGIYAGQLPLLPIGDGSRTGRSCADQRHTSWSSFFNSNTA